MKFKRAFVIVCDSMGIGNGKDAADYNDAGSNTFKHIDDALHLNTPELDSLGIRHICDVAKSNVELDHSYAVALNEASLGKDTLTGHYELMGLKVTQPFKTFTDTGFPQELIEKLEELWGRKIIGNKSASGTEIIKELGEQHVKTGDVIVYTSSDSVLQICAHEDVISIEELYKMCEQAREITMDEKYKLGRIIARPFIGTNKDDFKRTPRRHDYALKPFAPTLLNNLKDANYDVISIGKIVDIFVNEGITESHKIVSNNDGCEKIINCMKKDFTDHYDWYLYNLSIKKDAQGKGIASKLMRPMLKFCDDERMVAYLETNKEANVSLYQHYGFSLMKAELIPKSPVTHYSMVRKPEGEK